MYNWVCVSEAQKAKALKKNALSIWNAFFKNPLRKKIHWHKLNFYRKDHVLKNFDSVFCTIESVSVNWKTETQLGKRSSSAEMHFSQHFSFSWLHWHSCYMYMEHYHLKNFDSVFFYNRVCVSEFQKRERIEKEHFTKRSQFFTRVQGNEFTDTSLASI